ncbi:MAG: hypothetical protein RJB13_119 [Pseudomonadota bacterium]
MRSLVFTFLLLCIPVSAYADTLSRQGSFKDVEVRVIRRKFFQKSVRVELGANLGVIMNSSFTYTILPTAKLGIHLSEWLELYGEGTAGFTINKSDCTELGGRFNIEPIVDEVGFLAGGGAAITPVYGKYQLDTGDVIYFDWFVNGGAGMASMVNRKQGCKPLLDNEAIDPPTAYTEVGFNFGTGQRYFLNQTTSLNWGLRLYLIPGFNGGTNQNVTLSAGAGYYL